MMNRGLYNQNVINRYNFLIGGVGSIGVCLLAIFPTSSVLFMSVLLLGVIISFYGYIQQVSQTHYIKLGALTNFSIGFGYCLSTLGFALSNGTFNSADIVIFVAGYPDWFAANAALESIGYSLCIIVSTQLLLLFVDIWIPKIYTGDWRSTFEKSSSRLLLFIINLMMFYAFLTQQIGVGGIILTSENTVTPLAALSALLIPACLPLSINLAEKKRFWMLNSICLFIILVFMGRRFIWFSLLITPIVFSGFGVRFNYRMLLKLLPWIGLVFLILYFAFLFFVGLRLSMWELGEDASIFDIFQNAINIFIQGDLTQINQYIQDTTAGRSLIIYYLGIMITASDGNYNMPLYGDGVVLGFLQSIPKIFYPQKIYLPPDIESFSHIRAGIPYFDGPDTIIVSGFIDFGILGALIYPIIKIFIYAFFYKAILKISPKNSFVPIVMILIIISSIFYIEQSITMSIGVIRDGCVFFVVTSLMLIIWKLFER